MFGLILALVAAAARADDLFQIHAETTTGEPAELTVGGSRLPRLVRNVIDRRGEFMALADRDIAAAIRYAGVDDALLLSINADQTEATLSIPATSFERTFTAADTDDLEDQVVDFLLEDGASEYAAFLREMNRSTPLGVTDGNPRATTGFLADQTFRRFALHPSGHLAGRGPGGRRGVSSRFDLTGGSIRTDPGDGYYVAGGMNSTVRFTRRVALSLSIPGQYRRIEGAEIFDLGAELALPVTIFTGSMTGISWQITPSALVAGSFSHDFAAGGILYGGGVSSTLAWQLGGLRLSMANQLTTYEGTRLSVRGYRFETDLSQQVLKNALGAAVDVGPVLYVDGSIGHTRFLRSAAVRDYFSPGVGAGVRFGPRSGLRVGYAADLGRDFRSHNGNVALYFGW